MGTRGLITIKTHKTKFSLYNHWDSYPSGLGKDVTNQIKNLLSKYTLEQLETFFSNVVIVNNNTPPTAEEIEKLKKYSDLSVSSQSYNDWYCLLRNCQGNLNLVLESGYALNETDPDYEYEYIIDFTTNEFRVAGCMETRFDLDNIPENWWIQKNESNNDSDDDSNDDSDDRNRDSGGKK